MNEGMTATSPGSPGPATARMASRSAAVPEEVTITSLVVVDAQQAAQLGGQRRRPWTTTLHDTGPQGRLDALADDVWQLRARRDHHRETRLDLVRPARRAARRTKERIVEV